MLPIVMANPSKPKKRKAPGDPAWKILWPGDRGATKGDSTRETLHAAVGFALSKWEELEDELAKTFTELVGARWGEPAVRAYGSVNNFHGRADMLDAAADAFFYFATYRKKIAGPDALIAKTKVEYDSLIKYCRNFAGRRNEIAHGRHQSHPELGHFLRPAQYNSKKYTFDEPFGLYSYTSVEISTYASHFEQLIQRSKDVRSAVASIAEKIS
jgi:hypothetical protein